MRPSPSADTGRAGRGFRPGDRLDLVIPVHNEVSSIEHTLAAWREVGNTTGADLTIIVCEDGSTDGTQHVLRRAATDGSIVVITGPDRKGYSRAVVDGLRATTAPWVCCADGDGQCDPSDLAALLARSAPDTVVVGVRRPRRDPIVRRVMSGAMNLAFVAIHRIRLADPSSPYCLMPGEVARSLASDDPLLPHAYWWEFHVRRRRMGIAVREITVHHRMRQAGATQVYLPRALPGIVVDNLHGLWRLRNLP